MRFSSESKKSRSLLQRRTKVTFGQHFESILVAVAAEAAIVKELQT